jgi:hypothetical protein
MGVIGILLLFALLAAVFYFAASGFAFALMYRVGTRFPSRLAGSFFKPLERLAQFSPSFCRLYNGFHVWCYKRIVGGPLYNGWPPPPPTLGA